jgi:hypothetical protein
MVAFVHSYANLNTLFLILIAIFEFCKEFNICHFCQLHHKSYAVYFRPEY